MRAQRHPSIRCPRRLTAAAVIGLLTALAATAPAQADSCFGWRGNAACVRQTNTRVDACDRVKNGRKVRAHYITIANYANGVLTSYIVGDWDLNGSARGCARNRAPAYVLYYQLCEQGTGCSTWRRAA